MVDMPLSTNAVTNETIVRFARKVSHDLNNFSTVVRTYSELLLSDLPPDSPTYADVAEIQRAAESMVQYLQRVTRFARAGSMKRTPISADVGAQDAVALFGTSVPARPVHLDATSAATIQADAIWWRDVVLELLQNAHDAAPAGTPVTVRTVRDGDHVLVSVEDRGPGFPSEVAEIATEPMVTAKAGVRGAGMGLAIVGAFVGAVHGTITVERQDDRTVVALRIPAT
jgi:signal transduction histidine kinase